MPFLAYTFKSCRAHHLQHVKHVEVSESGRSGPRHHAADAEVKRHRPFKSDEVSLILTGGTNIASWRNGSAAPC